MWHDKFGAINLLLRQLGLPGDTRWLLETQPIVNLPQIGLVLPLSFIAVLFANVWLGWPFMMVIATGALQSIPKELYEAADVDGATSWQQFWRITLPLIRPAMVPAIMIGIMMTFNQFNIIFFVTGGGPIGLTEILVTQGFKLVNPQGWYGVASAFNIIVFIILAIITLTTNRVSRATEPYNAYGDSHDSNRPLITFSANAEGHNCYRMGITGVHFLTRPAGIWHVFGFRVIWPNRANPTLSPSGYRDHNDRRRSGHPDPLWASAVCHLSRGRLWTRSENNACRSDPDVSVVCAGRHLVPGAVDCVHVARSA
jgi:hypothetical protein